MLLTKIVSAATVTLVTFDTAIPTDKRQLKKLGLDPDGWRLIPGSQAREFLTRFKKSQKKTLEVVMNEKSDKLRLGGSVFTTLYKLLEFCPQIKKGVSFVSVGSGDGLKGELDSLVSSVNQKRKYLITEIENEFKGRLFIDETISLGVTPVCISFYQKGKRSMIMLRDEQEVRPSGKLVSELKSPTLLLVDTRELIQKSYKKAALALASRPKTILLVGLGASSILKKAIPDIKELIGKTKGEVGFSGNKSEVEVLVKHWDGISTVEELMKTASLRFILETNGQSGATLHFMFKGKFFKASYRIPKKEIYYGDTTNAGDVFLAGSLAGLMEVGSKENIEKELKEVLKGASRKTLIFLRAR